MVSKSLLKWLAILAPPVIGGVCLIVAARINARAVGKGRGETPHSSLPKRREMNCGGRITVVGGKRTATGFPTVTGNT